MASINVNVLGSVVILTKGCSNYEIQEQINAVVEVADAEGECVFVGRDGDVIEVTHGHNNDHATKIHLLGEPVEDAGTVYATILQLMLG